MKERLIVYLRGSRIGCIEFDHDAMAMEIGGHYEFKDVTRESFAAFAEKCDISPRAVFDRLDALVETLPQKAQGLAEEMSDEGCPSPIYARIGEVIGEQAERVT